MRFSYHRGTIFQKFELQAGMSNFKPKMVQKPPKMHPKTVPKPYKKSNRICIAKRQAFHVPNWPTWAKNGTPKGTQKPTKSNPKGALRAAISGNLMKLRSGAALAPKMCPKSFQNEPFKVPKRAPNRCCTHALPKIMAFNC